MAFAGYTLDMLSLPAIFVMNFNILISWYYKRFILRDFIIMQGNISQSQRKLILYKSAFLLSKYLEKGFMTDTIS